MAGLSPEQIARNFEDIHPPFDLDEAIAESSRCLFCYDAPCTVACPTHIDVPSFIRKILTRNLKGSARTILEANIFGGTCARACPTEVLCEGACVLNHLNKKPIDIGRLQRVATDHVLEKGIRLFEPGPQTGKKVAIIGGGPAGLTCAHELAKLGHKAVVFESREKPGGLNTYGIAGYKMTTEFSLQEVELVRQIGIEIRTNAKVGKDVKIEDLLRDYDAVFLGVGLGRTGELGIPGENLKNCEEALEFIAQTRAKPFAECKVGRRVAVVGGGNTAVDVGTAAKRLGAEDVMIVYRRSRAEMPAYDYEFDISVRDGCRWIWQTAPLEVLGSNGSVRALKCVKMELGEPDASGRRRPQPVAGSEFEIECDMVVKALGQDPAAEFLSKIPGLKLNKGQVEVDAQTYQTSLPKLFAGGDCINGGKEVVNAVEHGKQAARSIDKILMKKR